MKSKKSFKVFQIIFLITLFIAAMALGALSGAYYKSTRKGEGTVVFNKGLYYSIYNLSVDSAGTTVSEGNILYYTEQLQAIMLDLKTFQSDKLKLFKLQHLLLKQNQTLCHFMSVQNLNM
mgnify:CR=1 FL=1